MRESLSWRMTRRQNSSLIKSIDIEVVCEPKLMIETRYGNSYKDPDKTDA